MAVVSCLFAFVPPICAFRTNRCVRPYMAGTHVRRKKGKFWHIGGSLSVGGMVYSAQKMVSPH